MTKSGIDENSRNILRIEKCQIFVKSKILKFLTDKVEKLLFFRGNHDVIGT